MIYILYCISPPWNVYRNASFCYIHMLEDLWNSEIKLLNKRHSHDLSFSCFVVCAILWSTYASYWSDCCSPQQSRSFHRTWKEGQREGAMKQGWQTRKNRREGGNDGGWQGWRGWGGKERKEEVCGERWGGMGGNRVVVGGGGRIGGRQAGRYYECWPLSLYINLHINCFKWGCPCFLIFSYLTTLFSPFTAIHTNTVQYHHPQVANSPLIGQCHL